MKRWLKNIVLAVFISMIACSIPSPGSAGDQAKSSGAAPIPPKKAESNSPEVLRKDMGMSEFDGNQMLKYSVSPISGNVVIRLPQIYIPSQKGPPLKVTLVYNSQMKKQAEFNDPPCIFGNRWTFSYSRSLQHEDYCICEDPGDWEDIEEGDILKEEPEWDEPECCDDSCQDSDYCEFDEGEFQEEKAYLYFTGEGDAHFIIDSTKEAHENPYHYTINSSSKITFKDGTGYIFNGILSGSGGYISEIKDRYGNKVTIDYEAEGRPETITDAVGRKITLNYENGYVSNITTPGGRTYYYHYNNDQEGLTNDDARLIEIVNPEGGVTTFSYQTFDDSGGKDKELLTRITYPEGNSIFISYERNKCKYIHKDEGIEGRYYDYRDLVVGDDDDYTIITDFMGRKVTQHYEESGIEENNVELYKTKLVTRITDCFGEATNYEFDGYHNLISTEDTNALFFTMTYDSLGNMLSKTADPDGLNYTSTFTYETKYSQITSVTDHNNNTRYRYYVTDGLPTGYGTDGVLWKEVDAENNETRHWYNEFGQRTRTEDARGSVTLYGYGAWGYLTEVTQEGNYTTSFTYDTSGNKIEEVNANGIRTTYEYDSMNRKKKASIHDIGGPFETAYDYDFNGNLRFKTDPRGSFTEYSYDSADRLIGVFKPEDKNTYYQYDIESNKTVEIDPNGNTTRYEYDALNRLRFEYGPQGWEMEYKYGGEGNNSTQNGSRRYDRKKDKYTKKIDASDHSIEYTYDKIYRLEKETDHKNCYTEYEYDPVGNKIRERDKRGNWSEFSYDGRNLLIGTTDPEPFEYTVVYQYDAVGNKRFEKDRRDNWSEFSYDGRNLLIGITDPAPFGYTVTYQYDGVGNKRFETDRRANTTEYQYNGRNLLTKTINQVDGVSVETEFTYDANGNKLTEIDPNDLTTRFVYDDLNRMISKSDALWNTVIYVYDYNGNRTEIEDAEGNQTDYDYDALNRLIMVTDALSGETRYAYDLVGNKISTTDANWSTTTYVYDELNRLIETIDPLGNSTSYGYDCNGNRTSRNDGNGDRIVYQYDELNRLEARTFPDSSSVTYSYDPNGNRLTMVDPNGTIAYNYDQLNSMNSTTVYGAKKISYTYDENSNRISMDSPDYGTVQYPDYDELNRLKEIIDPQAGVTSYEYDPGSRLIEMTYPNGSEVVYKYDEANRILHQRTEFNLQTITYFGYTYDNVGNRLAMTDLQGTTTYQYDNLYRLTVADYPDSSWASYTYDAVGNRLYLHSPSGTLAYNYNKANELQFIDPDNLSSWATVIGTVSDLDSNGDPAAVVSVTVNGIPAVINSNTFTTQNIPIVLGENQITAVAIDQSGGISRHGITIHGEKASGEYTEFEYDGNGNLVSKTEHGQTATTTTYEYDYENRLTEVSWSVDSSNEFVYDGDKRRISKTAADGTVTEFLYDGLNILQDLHEDGTIKTAYLQGIGIDKLISVSDWDGQTVIQSTNCYHSDALGSVRSLTDEGGNEVKTYAYNAWGKLTSETGTSDNEYKFTGRRWEEEIGLQYNRARFYDPELGRFITRDPLTGGPDDPTISYFSGVYSQFHRFIKEHVDALQPDKHNRYAYCYNNPINLIDPLGLAAAEVVIYNGVMEAVTGGAYSSMEGMENLPDLIERAIEDLDECGEDIAKDIALATEIALALIKNAIEKAAQGKNPLDLSPDYSSETLERSDPLPDSTGSSPDQVVPGEAQGGAQGGAQGRAQVEIGKEGTQGDISKAKNPSDPNVMRENKQKLNKKHGKPPKQEDPKKDIPPGEDQLNPNQKRRHKLISAGVDAVEFIMKFLSGGG